MKKDSLDEQYESCLEQILITKGRLKMLKSNLKALKKAKKIQAKESTK